MQGSASSTRAPLYPRLPLPFPLKSDGQAPGHPVEEGSLFPRFGSENKFGRLSSCSAAAAAAVRSASWWAGLRPRSYADTDAMLLRGVGR
ncbi:hypothetical protein NDU88_005485 [Pleurodeles waltl]|uniref:Uncharacterized protein n=1 Tax=Pleurodeles waltl TaxID=8319 RepID=A0AAV7N4H8_PLEWA|nr:hypothetical protein NDU88_005485 [Pleurodeles waltl]